MSSETEDSDRALKLSPRSNLLHPEKKREHRRGGSRREKGKRRVMHRDTEGENRGREREGGIGT